MAKKSDTATASTQHEGELSKPSRQQRPRSPGKTNRESTKFSASLDDEATEYPTKQLEDVESIFSEHEFDTDEVKRLLDKFLNELKDFSTDKPLITALGAFALGFVVGRNSHR